MDIAFNKPYITGDENKYIKISIEEKLFSGDGRFTKKCESLIEKKLNIKKSLLTNSCTSALEISAILAEIKFGDEIIMPSYTFVSTANAFILRGGKPVFVDINKDTININENLIEKAITKKTKCIVVVHYAGFSCDMDIVRNISKKYNLILIEDAAQAISSTYKNNFLGSIGDLGTLSFHQTKNIHCGEGGALLINNQKFNKRSKILREKGTNRKDFMDGKVDKYEWVDLGSSYLASELQTAFLYSQLLKLEEVISKRLAIWNKYHRAFEILEKQGRLNRPKVPKYNNNNAHMYFLILHDKKMRDNFIKRMSSYKIQCTSHYIALHRTPFGKNFNEDKNNKLRNSEIVADTIVRLPLWLGLEEKQDYIIENAIKIISDI